MGTYTSDSDRDGVGIGAIRLTVAAASASGVTSGSESSAVPGSPGVELGWLGTALDAPSPSFVAVHPALPVVYAALETEQTVRAYRQVGPGPLEPPTLEPPTLESPTLESPTLEPFGEAWPAGSAVCHVAVDREARFVTAACWGDGRVLLFGLAPDGAIVSRTEAAPADDPYAALALATGPVEGQAPRQSRAHASLMLADGRIMTTDLGFDLVRVWRYGSGGLELDHEIALPYGSGPRHLVQHPDGTVFVVTEYSIEVVALRSGSGGSPDGRRSADDSLPRFAVAAIGPATAGGAQAGDAAAEIALSPDGRFVYVSVRGSNRIGILELGADGRLHPVADVPSGGDWPRHHVVVALPGVTALLVAHERSSDISLFTIDSTTGIPHPHPGASLAVAAPTAVVPLRRL